MYIRNQATVLSVDENGVPAIGPLRIKLKIQQEEGDAVETNYINIGTSKEYEVLEIFTSRWGSLGFAATKAVAVNAAAEIVAIARNRIWKSRRRGSSSAATMILGTLAVGDQLTWTPNTPMTAAAASGGAGGRPRLGEGRRPRL